MAILKKGSKGKPVSQLQTALNKNGASPKLKVDEIFGPKTEAGVKAFQKKKKVKVDGIVGEISSFVLGIGPRPSSLVVESCAAEIAHVKGRRKRNEMVLAKFAGIFAQSAAEADKLRAVLEKRQKMFEARQKKYMKAVEVMVSEAEKSDKAIMKEYEKCTDPARIKELRKLSDETSYNITTNKGVQEIAAGANKTIADLKMFRKGVKALQSKIAKE